MAMTGKLLTRLLRESGTGETGLGVCRDVLEKNPNASASKIVGALEADFAAGERSGEARRVGALTVEKAKQIARDGKYIPAPPKKKVFIEDEPDELEEKPKK
jgi:hypothetical protein